MVFSTPQQNYPLEVHLISWPDYYLGVWAYDEQGRRIAGADLRLIEPDRLFLRQLELWRYATTEMPEFARNAARDYLSHPGPDGPGSYRLELQGDAGPSTYPGWPKENQIWRPRPRSGEHTLLLGEFTHQTTGPMDYSETPVPALLRRSLSLMPGGACAWKPPRPALPGQLGALFQPGTRIAYGAQINGADTEIVTIVDPVEIGEMSVPSGRLIVDRAYVDQDRPSRRVRELCEQIPAGTYRVQAAMTRTDWEFQGETGFNIGSCAVRLVLAPEQVATWELAVCADDDVRLLEDGRVVGWMMDNYDHGCFADAAAWETLADRFACFYDDDDDDGIERLTDEFIRVHDDATDADMIAFPAGGDTQNPVWLGRAESGQIVTILAPQYPLDTVRVL
ncbi:DUF4241 domain-containing protein [Nocardia sp. NPDC057030]|uniref:DUF4241 domain-containing protein n=1 Tax=unclassified Nocardia TaxID=2637762 RepID=UPI00362E6357